jgi:Ca2+-binding EF-hand superfamily protein
MFPAYFENSSKQDMKALYIITIGVVSATCASVQSISTYSDWDSSSDNALDRHEFIYGYIRSNFFGRWSEGGISISPEEFYDGIFNSMDTDKNDQLTRDEFNEKIKYFYFGMFNGSFDTWDVNSNSSLDKNEFLSNSKQNKLGSMWDTSGDNGISQRELAGGMFYLCDANSNGQIDVMEFNIWKVNR